MDKLIHYGSVENIPYYNCSGKSDEEWYATGMKRPLFGWTVFLFGSFVVILYIPTICMVFKTKLIRHPCYKIIVVLGVTDMCASSVCSVISGILFMKGAVFCNYPTFIYISGALGLSCWCSACASTFLLVINRVLDVLHRPLAEFLFYGNRVFFWIGLIVIYGLCAFLFTPPILFNSLIMAWIGNTLVLENPTPEILDGFRNYYQITNNWIFAFGTCILYAVYCILVNKMQQGQKSKASKQVFIQSSIICVFNSFAALIYNALILIPTAPWVICFGELCWSAVHGCPAIIYLTMNKTIRHEFLSTFHLTSQKKIHTSSNLRNSTINGSSSASKF